MAYIPWWQRMSPPTFAERFELGGLAGRVEFQDGQLVQQGVPGVRQGYAGENYVEEFIFQRPSKQYTVEIKRVSGSIYKTVDTLKEAKKIKSDFLKTSTRGNPTNPLPEGAEEWWKTVSERQKALYKWNIKDKTLKEIWETAGGVNRPSIKDAYETQSKKLQHVKKLAAKGYIPLDQLTDEIGAYSGALSRALGFREMSEGSPSFIAKYPMLKNLIIRSNIAPSRGGTHQYFIKRPSEEVVDSLKDHFKKKQWRSSRRGLLNEDTVKRIQYAFTRNDLMEYLKHWKEGDKISDSLIKKVFGPEGVGESTVMQLGRVLQGKADVSGIEKNIKLGNKIIKAMNESSRKGGFGKWQSAAYKYARSEMDRLFKPGAKSFHGYQRLLHTLFTDAGLKNFNVDEINAIRTGWKSGTSPFLVILFLVA